MSSVESSNLSGHDEVSNIDQRLGLPEFDQLTECSMGSRGGDPGRRSGQEQVPNYRPVDVESLKNNFERMLVESVGLPEDEILPEASAGTFGMNYTLETVHGPDDRIQIRNTTVAPWRWICSLLITAPSGRRFIGTGWFISPRTLMTAGHVVYMHREGGWAREITVIPGRDGSSRPLGSQVATSFRSVRSWTENQDTNFDYGAIIMPDTSLGRDVGNFGFAALTDASLKELAVNLSGYPADKAAGTQWFHARNLTDLNARKIFYDIDTFGGQSGSPLWQLKDGQRTAIGIHTSGGTSSNSGTRINQPVYDNMQRWANP